jgi:hypothetical protein
MRRSLLAVLLLTSSLIAASDPVAFAARCTPLADGICRACKNCKYCGHCAKGGGRCSVCKPDEKSHKHSH